MSPQVENQLQNILEICKDGAEGYATVAEHIEEPTMKSFFGRMAQQRKLFVEEIKQEGNRLGVELNEGGTTKGFFHRNWMDIKASFGGNSDKRLIEDAITGEKEAVETYQEVITSKEVPAFLVEKLREQERQISNAIQQLHGLKQEVDND